MGLLLGATLLLVGGVTSYYALQRGRDPTIWFFVGLFFGLFALILLFIMPSRALSTQTVSDYQDAPSLKSTTCEQASNYELINSAWFYLDDNHLPQGPIVFRDLKKVWDDTVLARESLVWCEGMAEWKPIADMSNLEETLNK